MPSRGTWPAGIKKMGKAWTRNVARLAGDLGGLRRSLTTRDFLRYLGCLVMRAPRAVRSLSPVPVDQCFDDRAVSFQVGSVSVLLPPGNFSGGREMYARNVYLACPECRLPSSGWVLDLGANHGLFSLLAAKAGARVLAVEAQPGLVPRIEDACRRNSLPEGAVTVVNALIGASTGVFAGSKAWTNNPYPLGSRPSETTIDALAEAHGIASFEFVKMDVEGSEFALITAAAPWLDRVRCLAGEVHSEFGDPDALVRILEARGFQVARADENLNPIEAFRKHDGYLYAWRESPRGRGTST